MHFFFRRLAEEGDGKRIFVARRVCRSWKKFVDGMTNVEYGCIYAALCSDPILANYMDRIRLPDAFAAHSREMDPHHSFADLLKSELTQGGTSACVIDVLVWVLLDHLAKLGIDAACSAAASFALLVAQDGCVVGPWVPADIRHSREHVVCVTRDVMGPRRR